MMKAFRVHLKGIELAFAGRIAYRADFFISSIIMLIGDLIIPLSTYLIYHSGASFPGWSLYEIMLIQGIFMLSRGISSSLFSGMVWSTLSAVREGTFDVLLLKPHSVLHVLISTSFNCDDIGITLGGITLTGFALSNIPSFSVASLWIFLLLFLISLTVLLSFSILMSATVFKWVGNSRVYEIFESITLFGQYPVTIFSKAFAGLLTWVIPISMIAYIPAAILLGRPVYSLVPAVLASLILLALSLFLWQFMMKRHTSAGG